MPQLNSRKKHVRQTEKRTWRNRGLKRKVAELTRAAQEAARSGEDEEIQEALSRAYQAIDKAAKVGVIHQRRGGRKKSVLAREVAEIQAER